MRARNRPSTLAGKLAIVLLQEQPGRLFYTIWDCGRRRSGLTVSPRIDGSCRTRRDRQLRSGARHRRSVRRHGKAGGARALLQRSRHCRQDRRPRMDQRRLPVCRQALQQRQHAQALQQKYTAGGVVWLTIASSAPGEQGYVTPAEAKADLAHWRATPTDFLLDPDGTVGRLYDARATPHLVVIDRTGQVVYMGAIDDTPSTRLADVKTAHNYVAAALDAIAAGRPVAVASTRAYGCSIKYKDEQGQQATRYCGPNRPDPSLAGAQPAVSAGHAGRRSCTTAR
jgi:hypothetical protein